MIKKICDIIMVGDKMKFNTLENKEIAKIDFKPALKNKFFNGAGNYMELVFEKIYNEERLYEFLDYFFNDAAQQFEGAICIQNKDPKKNIVDSARLYEYGFKFSDDDKHFEMLVYHFNKDELPPTFK